MPYYCHLMLDAELANSDCESWENGGFCGFVGLEEFGKLEILWLLATALSMLIDS